MGMVACRECGKEISTEAAVCPQCGAPVRKGSAGPGPVASLGWFFGGLVVMVLAWAAYQAATAPDEGRAQARRAIAECWEGQGRKSLDPAAARLAAGACEMMTREFERKYGARP